jgi:hypothetical protein
VLVVVVEAMVVMVVTNTPHAASCWGVYKRTQPARCKRMAGTAAEQDELVDAIKDAYAPYYKAQASRALRALRPLSAANPPNAPSSARQPLAMSYFVRPGQTVAAQRTLGDVRVFLDHAFDAEPEILRRQALETASNAVQLLAGYERALHAALNTHYSAYFPGETFRERRGQVTLPAGTPLELGDVVGLLETIWADADSVTPPQLSQAVRDYLFVRGTLQVELGSAV